MTVDRTVSPAVRHPLIRSAPPGDDDCQHKRGNANATPGRKGRRHHRRRNRDRTRDRQAVRARKGAKVVVAELNAEAGEQTAQLIVQAGGEAIAIRTDVTEPDSIQATIDRAVQHYGALHVLHNNAGGSTRATAT